MEGPQKDRFQCNLVYVIGSNVSYLESIFEDEVLWKTQYDIKPAFTEETRWFLYFVNLAQASIEKKVSQESLLEALADYRDSIKGTEAARCVNGGLYHIEVPNGVLEILNITRKEKTIFTNVSAVALINGFELLSSLHCSQNDLMDMVLQEFFLNQKSPRALLQGVANIIISDILVNPVNIKHLHQFCRMLNKALDLDLMYILSKTLSTNDTNAMIENHHPFSSFKFNKTQQEDKTEGSMADLSSHPVHLTSGWQKLRETAKGLRQKFRLRRKS